MECTSALYCTLDENKTDIVNTLKAVGSVHSGERLDINNSLELNINTLFKALKGLDTQLNIDTDSNELKISLFPNDYPEDIYKVLMPWLHTNGAKKIRSEDCSEYGSKRFSYDGGCGLDEKDGLFDFEIEDLYVVFTGKMDEFTREEMEEIAEDLGANVQKSVNSKTQLLVVGEKPGESKLNKAEELGIEMMNGNKFSDILEDIGMNDF